MSSIYVGWLVVGWLVVGLARCCCWAGMVENLKPGLVENRLAGRQQQQQQHQQHHHQQQNPAQQNRTNPTTKPRRTNQSTNATTTARARASTTTTTTTTTTDNNQPTRTRTRFVVGLVGCWFGWLVGCWLVGCWFGLPASWRNEQVSSHGWLVVGVVGWLVGW